MIQISTQTLTFIGFIITIGGTIFTIFFYFQKPQIALEKRVAKLEDNDQKQDKDIQTIRDDHSKNTETMLKEMKELTTSINGLNVTVGKLETKIDERIPKGTPTLTPAGT